MAQTTDPARAAIESLDDGLIATMKAGKAAGIKGRAATIAPVIDRAFDLPLMTRLAVGATWTKIDPAEQAALVAAFRRHTITQYATNFDHYGGETFTITAPVETRASDRLVRTTLHVPKSDSVAIAYRLRQSAGTWKIIDVFYNDAISQLATRRAEFATTLSAGGAKALAAKLNAQSAKAGG